MPYFLINLLKLISLETVKKNGNVIKLCEIMYNCFFTK